MTDIERKFHLAMMEIYTTAKNISTKNGNAVVLSEEDYNNLMETLYISSIPGLKEDVIQGLNEDSSEYIPEEDVEWD